MKTQKLLPLVVDLDGTLIKTDVFYETFILFLKQHPLKILMLPLWWMKARAYLKKCLAESVDLDVVTLPYHEKFLAYLNEQHQKGREIVLATAADEKIAEEIAKYLGIFHNVFASNGVINLKSHAKAKKLIELYGKDGFVYAGNAGADLPVWAAAREAIIVNAPQWLIKKQGKMGKPVQLFE